MGDIAEFDRVALLDNAEFCLDFVTRVTLMQEIAHALAVGKGWWDTDRAFGELVALMHSELSEALEAKRAGLAEDKHLPGRDPVEVELADAVIRIFDAAEHYGLNIGAALVEKLRFNRCRPYKHGKEF